MFTFTSQMTLFKTKPSTTIMLTLGTLSLAGAGLLFVYIVGSHFHDPLRLRRFPAPSIFASLTPFWLSYQIWTGYRFKAVHEAHQKVGPVARIAPDHISFIHPQAKKEIYGHGSPNIKGDFFDHAGEGNPSMSQTTSKADHTRKRKALSHVFAARQITDMEPRVLNLVRKLCRDVHIKSEGGMVPGEDEYATMDGVFDVRPWLNMFSYDAISAMFFTESYGFLDKGSDICFSQNPSGHTQQVHAMDTYHSISTFNGIFATMPTFWHEIAKVVLAYTHNRRCLSLFGGMARYKVSQRLQNTPEEKDLFSNLPLEPTEKWPNPMPLSELIPESATMIDAGNDTTQTALTNCIYRLAKYPEKQRKLRAALTRTAVFEDPSRPAATYSERLQHVPYLRAVLDESFRCQPALASGLPRKVVSPITVAGYPIFPGTTVSVPLWSLHRDETLFNDASNFIPERFLREDDPDRKGYRTSEEEIYNLKTYFLPFSIGGRACIGRNLAYMEISMVIAALVMGFEWDLADPESEMPMIERFNCNPKELRVRAKARDGVYWSNWKA